MTNDAHDIRRAQRTRAGDWLRAFDDVLRHDGAEHARGLLTQLTRRAARAGVLVPHARTTPYVNTIPLAAQADYPGDPEVDERIEAMVRWNAAMMVVRANRAVPGIGGHLSTYASSATLFEVGFQYIFRGEDHPSGADHLYLQGHATPGIYARAFLEGRLDEHNLDGFRRELSRPGGLSSYPHPWLMPELWTYPTVSMGLAPLMAIYQARFNRYLEARRLVKTRRRVWALLGDGEMDEPESVAALTLAAREELSNLTFVVVCNLQRLDGPVRGNGKIIQELEALFAGAGWRVIKVIWSHAWEPLFEADDDGRLLRRLEHTVDGVYQRCAAGGPEAMRRDLFAGLEDRVAHLSDGELAGLHWGGHDRRKVYAAYAAAEAEERLPTVILAKTVKGFGLGTGEGLNATHALKALQLERLRALRDRLGVPVPDDKLEDAPYYRPAPSSAEARTLRRQRRDLGGTVPRRRPAPTDIRPPQGEVLAGFLQGTDGRDATTTSILGRIVRRLLAADGLGPRLVPIIPDEARTFGFEPLFREVGIYAPYGQLYEPVDAGTLQVYREAPDGQIFEEGITEAGAMGSFIAAGTAYAGHGVTTVPMFFFYSMFGLQRVGDLIWAAGDARARGFLFGATAGRTTLIGEGLQHQDGHSHLLALTHPHLRSYDPAYGYELAVLIEHGLERMLGRQRDEVFYITVANEPFVHPPMPKGVREGIVRGLYSLRASSKTGHAGRVQLLASGPLVREALRAQERLADAYGVTADVWSVTSWTELYRDVRACEREARLHPLEPAPVPYLTRCLGEKCGPVIAVSDWMRALPHLLAAACPEGLVALGTDGFGRSDHRGPLRRFFEIDAEHITFAALSALARRGRYPEGPMRQAAVELGIDPDSPDPSTL